MTEKLNNAELCEFLRTIADDEDSERGWKSDGESYRQCATAIETLVAACEAAVRYDAAIQTCANDPQKMASFCTAEGDDLDALYLDWITKARAALGEPQ